MPFQHNAPRPTKRLAVATRVSTVDQEEYGTSLDDQKSKGLLVGQLHDYSVEDRPYTEGGHIYSGDESGALPLAQRPIMRRLIADARAHRFDAVCFTKIWRSGTPSTRRASPCSSSTPPSTPRHRSGA